MLYKTEWVIRDMVDIVGRGRRLQVALYRYDNAKDATNKELEQVIREAYLVEETIISTITRHNNKNIYAALETLAYKGDISELEKLRRAAVLMDLKPRQAERVLYSMAEEAVDIIYDCNPQDYTIDYIRDNHTDKTGRLDNTRTLHKTVSDDCIESYKRKHRRTVIGYETSRDNCDKVAYDKHIAKYPPDQYQTVYMDIGTDLNNVTIDDNRQMTAYINVRDTDTLAELIIQAADVLGAETIKITESYFKYTK